MSACSVLDSFKSPNSFAMSLGRCRTFHKHFWSLLEPSFSGANNKMTNTMMNHIYLYKEYEEVQVGKEIYGRLCIIRIALLEV